ncbi:MAG: zinc ribbon domain-containing protein [Verrucomicrobiota bacterium]
MFYPMMVGSGFPTGYASATATAAASTAREASTNVELLSHDVDRLLMVTEALWTLMKQEHGYTDDVLTKLIEEIDGRKVVRDGVAVKDPPQACPNCGKLNSAKRTFCIYCGKPILANPFAR